MCKKDKKRAKKLAKLGLNKPVDRLEVPNPLMDDLRKKSPTLGFKKTRKSKSREMSTHNLGEISPEFGDIGFQVEQGNASRNTPTSERKRAMSLNSEKNSYSVKKGKITYTCDPEFKIRGEGTKVNKRKRDYKRDNYANNLITMSESPKDNTSGKGLENDYHVAICIGGMRQSINRSSERKRVRNNYPESKNYK